MLLTDLEINWLIITSILIFVLIILSIILIDKKKRVQLVVISLIFLYNFYAILSSINIFRRDYNSDIALFPLGYYLLYFIILNMILLAIYIVITLKFDVFKENRLLLKIQVFSKRLLNSLFNTETTFNKLSSFVLVIFFFYIVGFISTLIHELGHCTAIVLCGGYYNRIEINMFLGGLTSGIAGSNATPCRIFVSIAGLLAELIFGSIILSYILLVKEKSKFRKFSVLNIIATFFIHGIGYFTIYSLLDTNNDARTLASILNIDPFKIFLITLPFFIGVIFYSLITLWKFYQIFFKPKKFFPWIYLICVLLLYWYEIFFSLVIDPYNLPYLIII